MKEAIVMRFEKKIQCVSKWLTYVGPSFHLKAKGGVVGHRERAHIDWTTNGAQKYHNGIIFLSYEKSNDWMKKEMGTLHPLGRKKNKKDGDKVEEC